MASKILVNLDTSKEIFLNSKCKQNDDLILEANIYENGLAKDLTNCSISIQALKADKTYIIQNTDITKKNNKFIANLARDFTRVAGKTEIEVVLIESSKQNTTFSFYIEVIGSVIKGAVESSNTVTILEELENKIEEAGAVRNETEQLIQSGGAATKGDIAQVNSHLEQIDNKKATKDEVEVERKRIDLLTKTESGQTEGNIELLDIRVGANGKTYETSGEAVREQFYNITNKMFDLPCYYVHNLVKNWTENQAIGGSGTQGQYNGCSVIDYIPVIKDKTYVLDLSKEKRVGNILFTYLDNKDYKVNVTSQLVPTGVDGVFTWKCVADNYGVVAGYVRINSTIPSKAIFCEQEYYNEKVAKIGGYEESKVTSIQLIDDKGNNIIDGLNNSILNNKNNIKLLSKENLSSFNLIQNWTVGKALSGAGVEVNFEKCNIVDYIPVTVGKSYILYLKKEVPVGNLLFAYGESKNYLTGVTSELVKLEDNVYRYTPKAYTSGNTSYVRINSVNPMLAVFCEEEFYNTDYANNTLYFKHKKYYSKKYLNKNFIQFGDSITKWSEMYALTTDSDVGTYYLGYGYHLKNEIGCNYINQGVSGETSTQVVERLKKYDFTNIDVCLLAVGTNDNLFNNSIENFKLALKEAIEFIDTNYKNTKLMFISPFLDVKEGIVSYCNAMEEVGNTYGKPVLRADKLSGINPYNRLYFTRGDERHPNNNGYENILDITIPFVLNN